MSNPFDFSVQFLDKLKNYNRPVRAVIWVVIIAIAFLYLIFVRVDKSVDPIAQVVLIGMFADLGIYGISRTIEKNTQAKIDGNNTAIDKVGNKDTIDTKADINIKNDTD